MDKVAIVTGGAQEIGEAPARCLHADGFKVVILDFNEALAQQVASSIEGLRPR